MEDIQQIIKWFLSLDKKYKTKLICIKNYYLHTNKYHDYKAQITSDGISFTGNGIANSESLAIVNSYH